MGIVMNRSWLVVRQTGSRVFLESGNHKMTLVCPLDPEGKRMFMRMKPGQTIDDETLERMTNK
jgi:predicted RNA binding protein YcfA (HicA-like mRNA interferase family)